MKKCSTIITKGVEVNESAITGESKTIMKNPKLSMNDEEKVFGLGLKDEKAQELGAIALKVLKYSDLINNFNGEKKGGINLEFFELQNFLLYLKS